MVELLIKSKADVLAFESPPPQNEVCFQPVCPVLRIRISSLHPFTPEQSGL